MSEMMVLPIFYKKCEYADLEYLQEAIYDELVTYCESNQMGIKMADIVMGEFEVRINWRKQ
jgi:hypothetical protein